MMPFPNSFRTAPSVMAFIAIATVASAQEGPSLHARALAPNTDNNQTVQSAVGPIQAAKLFQQDAFCCGGFGPYPTAARAEARADFGSLGAYASIVNGYLAFGGASWRDQFTITGAPNGTVLEFDVTMSVIGDLSRLANSFRQSAQVQAWITGFPNPTTCLAPEDTLSLCNVGVRDQVHAEGRTVAGSYIQTLRVQLVAGQVYDVTQSLTAYSYMDSGYFFPEALLAGAFATADFLAGTSFSITPVSPGAGYTAASGHRYDAPTTNTAPTADAGANQSVRLGAPVHLDGSGSFDDNTPTEQLQFEWSFVSVPDGSEAALTDPATMAPSFVPDRPGDYVLQLVVTDQGAVSSTPSQITISDNPPPTANAGLDRLVMVGSVVPLVGAGADPEGEPLVYTWELVSVPVGSGSQVANPSLAETTFIPDRAGVYTIQLTVSDSVGPGEPDSVEITAMTASGFAESQIQAASDSVLDLPGGAVTNRGNQNALTQFLSNAVLALQSDDLNAAGHQIAQAIRRTDGCALRGAPDGNGPGRDWITTCDGQNQVYPLLVEALAAISP